MSENATQEPAPTDDDAIRQRLLGRIAVAAVIIVGLLGSLAMFDALYTSSGEPPATLAESEKTPAPAVVAEAPVAVGETPDKPVVATAETEAPAPAGVPGSANGSAVPASAPPPPEISASPGSPPLQALPQEKPLTRPATAKPALIRPSDPAPLPPLARPDPRREIARSQGGVHAPASRPLAQALEHQAERMFALQLGVFSNIANAEDLRAKLEQAGIPATVEARVRAGPFANRAEAEGAREKLKALGIAESIMVSVKK